MVLYNIHNSQNYGYHVAIGKFFADMIIYR